MVTATSPRNASAAVPTASAPCPASSRAGPGERFQTRSRCPAESSLDAMARPMAPSPMNPISIPRLTASRFNSAGRPRLVTAGEQPLGEVEPLLELADRVFQALDRAALRLDLPSKIGPIRLWR